MGEGFQKISCNKLKLCLDKVLVCGQSFRWKKNGQGEWLGVMAGHVWRLKQTDDEILYKCYRSQKCSVKNHKFGSHTTSHLHLESSSQLSQNKINISTSDNGRRIHKKQRKVKKFTLKPLLSLEQSEIVTKSSTKLSRTKNNIVTSSSADENVHCEEHSLLYSYFQLDVDLETLYKTWSTKDPYFSKIAVDFHGIRILKQDPVENLFSFVCSLNNNIARISSMVEKLCVHFGQLIVKVDGTDYYSFPSPSSLCADNVESELRKLGFGYRAKFIANIAKVITEEKSETWLHSLKDKTYKEAKAELMTLYGVGAKVADCVCLMSLNKSEALPIDTHIWQITKNHYMPQLLSAKSVTDRLYNEIGEFYRNLWGPYCGWAQSVLFTADLKVNKRKIQAEPEDKCQKKKKIAKGERKCN